MAQDPLINQMMQKLQKLKPEQQDKIRRFLTPQVATAMGVLLGDGVGAFIKKVGRSDLQSVPIPVQVTQFLGEEKLQKFIDSNLEKAQELQQQEVQRAGGQRQGLAAPPQQTQQAPVSPPAPTGLASRPQLPLPSSSNAAAIDNQPIK